MTYALIVLAVLILFAAYFEYWYRRTRNLERFRKSKDV